MGLDNNTAAGMATGAVTAKIETAQVYSQSTFRHQWRRAFFACAAVLAGKLVDQARAQLGRVGRRRWRRRLGRLNAARVVQRDHAAGLFV